MSRAAMVKSLVPLPRGFFLLCYQIDPYMELCPKWEKGDGGIYYVIIILDMIFIDEKFNKIVK